MSRSDRLADGSSNLSNRKSKHGRRWGISTLRLEVWFSLFLILIGPGIHDASAEVIFVTATIQKIDATIPGCSLQGGDLFRQPG